jgi:uncharacterized protein (TIGR03086 family)
MITAGRLSPPELLSGALAHALEVADGVRADDLDRASPCAGWTVDDVLRHLLDSFDCLSAALNFGRVDLDEEPPRRTLLSALAGSAGSLDHAARRRPTASPIAIGGLPLPREKVILVAAVEATVHGWDVSAGTGRPRPIPDPLAIGLLHRLPEVVTVGTAGFAPALPSAGATSPGHRLLASVGRDWRFG